GALEPVTAAAATAPPTVFKNVLRSACSASAWADEFASMGDPVPCAMPSSIRSSFLRCRASNCAPTLAQIDCEIPALLAAKAICAILYIHERRKRCEQR